MGNTDPIYCSVGKIIINLQSFELMLRIFLYETIGPKDPVSQLDKLSIGDMVTETPITNYDTMGTIIKKVNEQLVILGRGEKIDETLVHLRDSIVHGRAISKTPGGISRLFKFKGRKKNEKLVEVDTSVDLTPQWLSSQVTRVHEEMMELVRISKELGLSCFQSDRNILWKLLILSYVFLSAFIFFCILKSWEIDQW